MKSRRRFIRRLRTAIVLSLCVPLSASAGALAVTPGHTTADHPAPHSSPSIVGDTPADYRMPGAGAVPVRNIVGDSPADYAPAQRQPAGAAPARAHVPGGGGFDWPSAAIGAAGAGLLIVLSMGGVSALSQRRTRLAR
jgi:hypothetical protein